MKWRERIEAKRIIIGKMKQLTTLSKSTFRKNPRVIPISAFLACMNV